MNKDQLIESEITTTEKIDEPVQKQARIWLIVVISLVFLGLVGLIIFLLFRAGPALTTQIRDVFIIFLALEFIVLGVALVVLIVQLAKLVNLIENDVKPILSSTSETINTLKGTTEFLSKNLVNPVITLNSNLAGLKKVLDLLKIFRK